MLRVTNLRRIAAGLLLCAAAACSDSEPELAPGGEGKASGEVEGTSTSGQTSYTVERDGIEYRDQGWLYWKITYDPRATPAARSWTHEMEASFIGPSEKRGHLYRFAAYGDAAALDIGVEVPGAEQTDPAARPKLRVSLKTPDGETIGSDFAPAVRHDTAQLEPLSFEGTYWLLIEPEKPLAAGERLRYRNCLSMRSKKLVELSAESADAPGQPRIDPCPVADAAPLTP
jgi:hypothetical protein